MDQAGRVYNIIQGRASRARNELGRLIGCLLFSYLVLKLYWIMIILPKSKYKRFKYLSDNQVLRKFNIWASFTKPNLLNKHRNKDMIK